MAFIVNRILPVSVYYDKICSFINFSAKKETGVVCKAFAEALKIVIKEYTSMINKLEVELMNDNLDMQQLWFFCQKPIKILENISRLCSNCYMLKGGNLINTIYNFLQNTSDFELQKVYLNLIEKAFIPYMEMLKNWVCSGYLEDCYDEFMVSSNKLFTKENIGVYYNELYWDKKYFLNKINVSLFLNFYSKIRRFLYF